MSDVMIGRPMKFRILEIYSDGKDIWSNDAVAQLMSEYKLNSDFQRDSVNFDLLGVMASGFIESTDTMTDAEGKFRKGALLYKFKITELGQNQYKELVSKVKPKKGA